MQKEQQLSQVKPLSKDTVIYQSAGNEVILSYEIVRNYLVRGNGQVLDSDIVQFISLCRYNQLNPFLNEAYLVKFGTTPATMVVSKEAFFKRAEDNENYEGVQSGVIVSRNNEVLELEGAFYLDTDKLLGGWAKVYRSDRKFPLVAKVLLSEYDKGQSVWKEKRGTMISKVAKVQALREAFPAQLGALYTQEEQNVVINTNYTEEPTNNVKLEFKQVEASVDTKAADVDNIKLTAGPDENKTIFPPLPDWAQHQQNSSKQ